MWKQIEKLSKFSLAKNLEIKGKNLTCCSQCCMVSLLSPTSLISSSMILFWCSLCSSNCCVFFSCSRKVSTSLSEPLPELYSSVFSLLMLASFSLRSRACDWYIWLWASASCTWFLHRKVWEIWKKNKMKMKFYLYQMVCWCIYYEGYNTGSILEGIALGHWIK